MPCSCSVFFTCRGGQLVDLDACPGGLCFDVASGRCEELCLGSCSSGRVREGGVPGTAAAYGDRHQGEPNAKRLRGQRGRAEGSGSVVSDRVLLRRPGVGPTLLPLPPFLQGRQRGWCAHCEHLLCQTAAPGTSSATSLVALGILAGMKCQVQPREQVPSLLQQQGAGIWSERAPASVAALGISDEGPVQAHHGSRRRRCSRSSTPTVL